jgi:hypothetical protein
MVGAMQTTRTVAITMVSTLGIVAVLAGTAAPQASATVECANVPSCSSIVGPWVVVPPQPNVGATDQITAIWLLRCDVGEHVIGSDWQAPDDVNPFTAFTMWIGAPMDNVLYPDYDGIGWGAENLTSRPQTFQPLLGCSQTSPAPVAARAAESSRLAGGAQRIVVKRLRPHSSRDFSMGCPRGQRMVASGHAVAFYTRRPPALREMREVASTGTQGQRTLRVRVTTGEQVGDNEHVGLQMQCSCQRSR